MSVSSAQMALARQACGVRQLCTPALAHVQPQRRRYQMTVRAVFEGAFEQPARRPSTVVFSQQECNLRDPVHFPLTMPLLPFAVEEVLLPGAVKTLHLFEARYLAMLEEVLSSPNSNKLFAHVVVEQPGNPVGSKAATFPGAYIGEMFIFLMGTLVRVVEVKKVQVGVLVRIQAEGRVAIKHVSQLQPYMRGAVQPLLDQPIHKDEQQIQSQMQGLISTMQDLQNLTMKFKSRQTAALQQAMYWWEKQPLIPTSSAQVGNDSARASSAGQQTQWSAISGQNTIVDAVSSGLDSDNDTVCDAGMANCDSSDAAAEQVSSSSSSSSSSIAHAAGSIDISTTSSNSGNNSSSTASAPASSSVDHRGHQGGYSLTEPTSSHHMAEAAARLSFAALQAVPEASPKEGLKLLRACVNAMETTDTSARLKLVRDHMQETFKLLAAKCALKALQLS